MDADQRRDGGRKGIERELKRGTLELIVLHLLAPGEAYGYEIVSTLTAQSDGEAAARREELTVTTFDSYVEQVLDRIPHHLPLRDEVAQDLRSTFADRQALGESADEAIRQ